MNTHPIRVGSCLFTMVDPERGHEVAYNRWYERDHNYQGLADVAVDPSAEETAATDTAAQDAGCDELEAFLRSEAPPELMNGSTVASMVSWCYVDAASATSNQAPMDLGTPPGPPGRRVQMFFLDGDPAEAWDGFRAYGAELAASGKGRVAFAAPFLPTIVGSDSYMDRLW